MTSEAEPPPLYFLEVAMAALAGFAGIYVRGRVNPLSWTSLASSVANSFVAACIGLFTAYMLDADSRVTLFASMMAGYIGTDAMSILVVRMAIKHNWFGITAYLDPILIQKLGVKPEELNPIPPVVKPPKDEA